MMKDVAASLPAAVFFLGKSKHCHVIVSYSIMLIGK